MIRTIGAIALFIAILALPASSAEADWVRVTTEGGQVISLANFGFYAGTSWDCIAEFHVEKSRVEALYGGVRTRVPLEQIRVVTLEAPAFTEPFGAAVIELEDGTRLLRACPEVIGVAGETRSGSCPGVRFEGRARSLGVRGPEGGRKIGRVQLEGAAAAAGPRSSGGHGQGRFSSAAGKRRGRSGCWNHEIPDSRRNPERGSGPLR
jgi:hypothetical protein